MTQNQSSCRDMLFASETARASPSILLAQNTTTDVVTRGNIMAFKPRRWQDHFDEPGKGVIVADIASCALHFSNRDGETYKPYPSSVPQIEELTKRGYTEVVHKRVGPDWTPLASMVERDTTLKYMPPVQTIRLAPMRCPSRGPHI